MCTASLSPRARRERLVIQELGDEVLIYDLDRHQASCLNRTAALVWKYADGQREVSEIAAQMAQELGAPVDTRLVWYALKQLSRKHLLEERVAVPPPIQGWTRRDFLKAGLVGTAVAAPVIVSMAAPTPAMAASCKVSGQPCTADSECCSGMCSGGLCI